MKEDEEITNSPISGYIECNFEVKISYNGKENDSEWPADRIKRQMFRHLNQYIGFPNRKYIEDEFNAIDAPQRFINTAFTKHFKFSGNGKAYLSDYHEKEGSLIIAFTVVIIGTALNYGGIRETIDYFADDLEKVCEMAMGSKYDVNVKHNEKKKVFSTGNSNYGSQLNPSNGNLGNSDFQSLLKKVTVNRIMIGGTIFLILLLFSINILQQPEFNKSDNKQDIEKLVEEKIQNLQRDQKIDEIINGSNAKYQVGDTVILGIIKEK
ncbi:MAG: hypothetical protein AAF600_22500 [Bacteroidota bacterium]